MSTAYSSAKQKYIGNGVTTEWGFDFPIQKHSELKVYLKRSVSPQVLLEEGVDYSFVTENTIAFPIKAGESKLQATDVLALQRESVFESEYNFSNQQRLEPEEVMHADDNLERQIQELKRDSESAIKVQPTSNINTDEYFIAVESIYENLDNITNVSEHSSEIITCSDNISDISTVSSNIANVNTVGQSISNVNTVAGNVASVNTVAGVSTDVTTVAGIASSVPTVANNSANVATVATNISDVNTAATNIEAIKDAPNQASNAAQSATNATNSATDSANSATASAASANNSHIWAEGTDAQVQALGGVHSSKVWAEQSTNVNIALTNSPYTTNRILEIPQDIKWRTDLVETDKKCYRLTILKGSVYYVPQGFEADGVTRKFSKMTMIADNTCVDEFWSDSALDEEFVFLVFEDNVAKITSSARAGSNITSGDTAPTTFLVQRALWYDTKNNYVKFTEDSGATWYNCSLPLLKGSPRNAIDETHPIAGWVNGPTQVFNGFGYIGSTIFCLPGIKCLVGNGRNPDGSCITKIEESTKVSTFTMELHRPNNKIVLQGGIVGVRYSLRFDEQANMCYNNATNVSTYQPTAILGTFSTETTSPWNITEFNPLGVDSLVNSNASNFSQAGRSYLSGLGMPSGRYIDLTLGASDSTYTAPANGWLILNKASTRSGQEIRLTNKSNQLRGYAVAATNSAALSTMIPCRKGDTIYIYYSAAGSVRDFRFVYAEGEQNV